MEAIASHNPWSSLAEDEEDDVANMYPSRNNALVLLNTKASGLKMVCHKIAEEIESHNSGKPSGPLIVTGKLPHSIRARIYVRIVFIQIGTSDGAFPVIELKMCAIRL